MSENSIKLIDDILSGKTMDIENTFQSIMADKITEKLDAFRKEVGQGMFKESEEISDKQILEDIQSLFEFSNDANKALFQYVKNTSRSFKQKDPSKKSLKDRILGLIKGKSKLTKEQVEIIESALLSEEELDESIKVGDHVHVGHMVKGGAGVKGKVTKINGDTVHIEQTVPSSKFGPRTWKGRLSNAIKIS